MCVIHTSEKTSGGAASRAIRKTGWSPASKQLLDTAQRLQRAQETHCWCDGRSWSTSTRGEQGEQASVPDWEKRLWLQDTGLCVYREFFWLQGQKPNANKLREGKKKKGKKKLGNVVVNDPEWFAEWRKSQKNVSFSILSPFLPVAERSHPVAIGSPRLVIATKRESFLYFRGGLRSALFEFRAQSLWPGVWELLLAVSEPGAHSRRQRSRKSLYKS